VKRSAMPGGRSRISLRFIRATVYNAKCFANMFFANVCFVRFCFETS